MEIKIEGIEQDKLNPKGYGGMCSRSAVIDRESMKSIDEGIPTIATTSAPAVVIDWNRYEYVREILPMRYAVMPDNDKTILLDTHSRISIHKNVGYTRNWNRAEKELRTDVFISKAEESIRIKVDEGTIDSVSIGYETAKEYTVEISKGAVVTIDGVEYRNEFDDDMPLLVRTWWKVKELSLVPIGADQLAKLKRAAELGISAEDPELQKKLNEALDQIKSMNEKINSLNKGEIKMGDENKNEEEKLTHEQIVARDKPLIEKFGKERFNGRFKGLSEVAMRGGMTFDQFATLYTDELERTGGGSETPNTLMGLSAKNIKDFSITRAAQAIIRGERKGLEFEISEDLEKRTGIETSGKSILIPADIQNVGLRQMMHDMKRAHTTTDLADFITPEYQPGLLKDVVRNDTVLGQLGISIIDGLRGPFQMPKVVTGLTMYNVGEDTAATISYITVDLEEVSPKRISGNTIYGKQAFMQSDARFGGLDAILMKELYASLNLKVDTDGINGTGAGNNPRGILNQTVTSAPSLATVDLKHIVNVIRKVKKANGLKQNMKWLSSADVEALLRITPIFPTGHTDRTLYEAGQIETYPSLSSNQVPDAYSIFGDWSQFYMLNWGVEELIVADQPKHKEHMVELSIHRYCNFFLRSPESFAIADDVPVSTWTDLDA